MDQPHRPQSRAISRALRSSHARYYKLTPPFTLENLRCGHGFHFLLPAADEPEIFLDIMGAPPRVGSFEDAVQTAQWIDGEWGRLHVIGLRDLVELKKTQRLEDYPVISRLALAWLDAPGCKRKDADLTWALDNIFTVPEMTEFLRAHPAILEQSASTLSTDLRKVGRQLLTASDPSEEAIGHVNDLLQQRIARLQQADRQHWRGIIAQLRKLRESNQLMLEGNDV